MPLTALFVAAFDSQLKWCGPIRDELAARGFSWQVVVPDVRNALSPEQISAAGFHTVERVSWAELITRAKAADVVVCGLSGPSTQSLTFDLAAPEDGVDRAPVVVTGWVGVIIEKITAGYLDRCGSDVVAVNARSDLEHFRHVGRLLDIPADNLLLSGLPLLGPAPQPRREGPICRVLFADQPTVPGRADERLFLYGLLADYARAHPDRQVLVKPRHRPEEDTYHRMLHHPELLLSDKVLPPNLRIDYTPITEQLPHTDLLLTVSSTACLEALDHGCAVALVLDLGVHERLGNHVFLDSGLLRTFDQIQADDLGSPTPQWRDSYFFPRQRSAAALIADRVEELVATGARPSRATRTSPYLTSAATYHRRVVVPRRVGRAARRPALRGRVAQVGHAVLPPVLVRPLRRMASHVGFLR